MFKQKFFIGIGAILTVLTLHGVGGQEILGIQQAMAVEPGTSPNVLNGFAQSMGFLAVALNVLGILALKIVEFFMKPEFLGHPGFMGPNGALKEIWILSRDIMNLLFASMLIVMAFYIIVTGNKEKMKEYIAYFVMAIVLVNFSWFFPRVIIDFAHVLTATVFSIPDYIAQNQQCSDLAGRPCTIVGDVELFGQNQTMAGVNGKCKELGEQAGANDCVCIGGDNSTAPFMCWTLEDYSNPGNNKSHGMVNGLAVNFGRITNLPLITSAGQNANASVAQKGFEFFFNLFFAVIFTIAIVFPLIGMAVGLLLRILILWVTMAFMPFAFLGFVINRGKLGTGIGGLDDYIWKEFLTAAFLPVLIAVPFTIGFIMILSASAAPPFDPASLPIIFDKPIVAGITDIWKLLWALFAMIIIWIGAFTALSKSKIIGSITEKIRSTGTTLGSAAAKIPLLIPLPLPGGTRTIGSAVGGPIAAARRVNSYWNDPKAWDKILAGGNGAATPNQVADANENLQTHNRKDINNHIRDYNAARNDEERNKALDRIHKILQDAGMKNLDRDATAVANALEQLNVADPNNPDKFVGIDELRTAGKDDSPDDGSGTTEIKIEKGSTDNHVVINNNASSSINTEDFRGDSAAITTAVAKALSQMNLTGSSTTEADFQKAKSAFMDMSTHVTDSGLKAHLESIANSMDSRPSDGSKTLEQALNEAANSGTNNP